MKRFLHFLICLSLLGTGYSQIPKVAAGEIEVLEGFESKYVDSRDVYVWLPGGYSDSNQYSVLYMHDGQLLFDSTTTWNGQEWGVDEWMNRLLADGVIENCIVVGIPNNQGKRHSEYFPQKPFESLTKKVQDSLLTISRSENQPLFERSVISDDYLRFLVEELKPAIDNRFSTRPGRENTFIMGSSMGGLISIYAISEYPEVFGRAACLSTHWPGIFTLENNPIPQAFKDYLMENLPDPKTHRIYFDFGTETLDNMYQDLQPMMDETMSARGYSPQNWITRKFEGADHSERSWNKRLDIPLRFLLGKED